MPSTTELQLSAVDSTIHSSAHPKPSPHYPLALEIKFNLQHQHNWRDLSIHPLSTLPRTHSSPATIKPALPDNSNDDLAENVDDNEGENEIYLLSGLPPRHSYIHPDLQSQLLKHNMPESALTVQREYVLPLSVEETWTLKRFAAVFERIPAREPLETDGGGGEVVRWCDGKRVVLGMMAHGGMGGDGTVTYYIMQEGEVKPRQNG